MSFDNNHQLLSVLKQILRACDAAESAVNEHGGGTEDIFEVLDRVRAAVLPPVIALAEQDATAQND